MDELIKQLLLLSEEEKRMIHKILEQEIEFPADERGIMIESINGWEQIVQRENDMSTENLCLITFDDHVLNTNIYK